MDTKVVKSIIEFVLKHVDWDSENLMPGVTELLYEKINVVIVDEDVVAVVQCNEGINTDDTMSNGELHVNVLLVDASDLTTDLIRANAKIYLGVVTVDFEERW